MIRALALLAVVLGAGCSPAGCDAPALAFRSPVGPNHYVAPADMASGGGTPTYVRASAYSDNFYGTGSPVTSAFTSNTAGNLIVCGVFCAYNSGTPVASVTDSVGNTYTQVTATWGESPVHSYDGWVAIYYAKNIAGSAGTNTVSVAGTGGAFDGNKPVEVSCLEYSGCSTTSPIAAYSAQGYKDTDNASVLTTGSFTDVSGKLDLAWAAVKNVYNDGWTPTAGYTQRGSPTTNAQWNEKAAVGGSTTMGGTTGGNTWQMIGIALQ